jgi:phage-related protein
MTATLNSTGFKITEVAGAWSVLRADFGDGYQAAACVGAPSGTRTWSIRIEALPGEVLDHPLPWLEGHPRAAYLWQFFQTSKANHDDPFWFEVEDPGTSKRWQHLASFTDHQLSYEVFCARVYGTGLSMRERRVLGQVSPVPALAVTPFTVRGDHNNGSVQ